MTREDERAKAYQELDKKLTEILSGPIYQSLREPWVINQVLVGLENLRSEVCFIRAALANPEILTELGKKTYLEKYGLEL